MVDDSAAMPASLPSNAVPGEDAFILAWGKQRKFLPGCGFGLGMPLFCGTLDVKLPSGFDLVKIERVMQEFIFAPIDHSDPTVYPEVHLVSRIHAWHATIQRDAKVPVFGACRLWDSCSGRVGGGVHKISVALPSYARAPSIATLQFVTEAIATLAPAAGNADSALPALRERFQHLLQLLSNYALPGTNSLHFIEAAHLLGIERSPVVECVWAFGLGCNRSYFNSSITSATPAFGVAIAKDKIRCSRFLAALGLPVATNALARNADAAAKLAHQIGYPVVIKPVDADQGLGVTAGVEDEDDLRKAFAAAAKVSKRVMVEKHHNGCDYRITVLHGNAVKVMVRRPGGVTGDGVRTVAELVAARNADDVANRVYTRRQRPPLRLDDEAQFQLSSQGLTQASIIPAGQFVPLRRRANISAGGTYDILSPDEIHADNRQLGENAALALGLDIAGIDIISADPRLSWRETGGIVCEVNAQPQIGYRDSEKLYGEILTAVLGGTGVIPVQLFLLKDQTVLPRGLPELAQMAQCNAAVWGTSGWIAEGGAFGPFANVFRAAKGVLLDSRVTSALVVMTEPELLRFGLPIARFSTIRLIGPPGWEPSPETQQLIAGHTQTLLRIMTGSADHTGQA